MNFKAKYSPYLLLLPAFGLICVFKIYPIIHTLRNAFFIDGLPTLANYSRVFKEKAFWSCLDVTLRFNLITIPLQIVIAFLMALLVSNNVRGIGAFRTIFYIPFAVSITVAVMVWNLMFQFNGGVFNSLLSVFGIEAQAFFNDKNQALWCIVVLASWKGCGYWMMYLMAGMKNIDPSIYEAAKIDGAGYVRTIFSIMLPLIRRVMLFVCVANTSANMLLFAPMQLITDGGPRNSTNVLMYEAYRSAFKYGDIARCAVIVSVLLMIIIFIALLQFFALGERDNHALKKGAASV